MTFGAGSTSWIDHFFITPKLLPRLRAVEVQPLVGGGQPYPPPFPALFSCLFVLSHAITRYRAADASPAGVAPVVEASDHSWISLQLGSSDPALRGAIVTGASSGIGRASAMLLAENGYAVAVCSRSAISLEAAFAAFCLPR